MLAEHWKISSRTSLSYFTRFPSTFHCNARKSQSKCQGSHHMMLLQCFFLCVAIHELLRYTAIKKSPCSIPTSLKIVFQIFFSIDYLKFRIKTCSIRMLMFWEEDTKNMIHTHGLVVTFGFGAPIDNASSNPDCNIAPYICF